MTTGSNKQTGQTATTSVVLVARSSGVKMFLGLELRLGLGLPEERESLPIERCSVCGRSHLVGIPHGATFRLHLRFLRLWEKFSEYEVRTVSFIGLVI